MRTNPKPTPDKAAKAGRPCGGFRSLLSVYRGSGSRIIFRSPVQSGSAARHPPAYPDDGLCDWYRPSPAGALYVLTRNLERLGEGWEQAAAISLFLKSEVSATKAEALARRLAGRKDLESVTLISPDQALDELRAETGFAEAVEQLETNPLPYVLALRPAQSLGDAASLEGLREVLTALPETDLVRMDTLWVRRFQGIILLGERAAQVLASALALGVLLVIGNTIRLEIENRRQEIVIMETVGATHAFIRRPFLWLGVWYGFLGGLIAWCLVSLALFFMQSPVSRLAALYQADFLLVGLGPWPWPCCWVGAWSWVSPGAGSP